MPRFRGGGVFHLRSPRSAESPGQLGNASILGAELNIKFSS